MSRHVAFLRGMNLGKRRISNEELRARFAALGFADVATFRASGNVIFDLDGKEPREALQRRIEAGLAASLGYEVPVFLRTAVELRAMAAHEPFAAGVLAASTGKLQVGLLASTPTAAARKRALALTSEEDRLALHARELYWLPSRGLAETVLDLKALAAALGPMTVRTKGTIDLIAAKHCAE